MRGLLSGGYLLPTEINFITWCRLDRSGRIGIGAGGICFALPAIGVEGGCDFCHEPGGFVDLVLMANQ